MVVLLVLIGMRGMGQVPTWEWARGVIGTTGGAAECWDLAIDNSQSIYITGCFTDSTLTFGANILYNTGNSNSMRYYIAKYDSSGNIAWAKGAGSSDEAVGFGITVDINGNIYVTGYYYSSTITFDTITLFNNGGNLAFFLVKYNSSGNVLWARGGDGSHNSYGNDITSDTYGNIYLTGGFIDTISFDSYTLLNGGAFITKYNSLGQVLWSNGGQINGNAGQSITTDVFGNVYMTGYFWPSIIFDTDTLYSNGSNDIFLIKYNSSGNIIWIRSAGGTQNDRSLSISTDRSGNIYNSGYFTSPSIIFGNDTLVNTSLYDTYLTKFDSSGNVLFAKTFGGTSTNIGWNLVVDSLGKIYLMGEYSSSITFDTITLPSPSGTDPLFLVIFDSIGNALYAKTLTSGGDDWGGLAVGTNGSIYIGEDFEGANTFIVGNDTLIKTGGEDIFVAKLIFQSIEGIPQISPQPTISLSPNPFSTSATLLIKGELKENSHLYIYNLIGQEAKTIPIINQKEITINRDNLADGMYFYKIIGDKNETIAVGKMVIE